MCVVIGDPTLADAEVVGCYMIRVFNFQLRQGQVVRSSQISEEVSGVGLRFAFPNIVSGCSKRKKDMI